ncbi:hypothetical protein N7478_003512 [Penicillium angulare]|uniref:uncharacterized protein n=1 Tax=Penicillium angulare TaxID=116970 RepID=UPI00254076EF|nr:uncharacterized protein N7478_003512 [Penicillium angulare]KAJ5287826.1 hypothetical protein N7478_003512 [Penicillium angulare]
MEDLDTEEGDTVHQLSSTGEDETNMSFTDAQGYLDPGNWDNSWLNSLTDDGSMPGDLVFGFFA